MIKLFAIFALIMALMNTHTGQIRKQAATKGIGQPAYHEPACGIGEAEEHVPGGMNE